MSWLCVMKSAAFDCGLYEPYLSWYFGIDSQNTRAFISHWIHIDSWLHYW